MLVLEAVQPIFYNGRIVEAGEKLTCPLDFGKKLIKNKVAKMPMNEKQEVIKEEKPQTQKRGRAKK